MKYDLKWLNTFAQVAKLKSFSKAAVALNISKSHVTTIVGQLEKALDVTLLARTTREVNLTSDGHSFLEYCQAILDQVENLDNFLDQKKEITGSLRIVLPPYFSRNYIVPKLKDFLALYPKLKLYITLTEDPVNIIEEGFDLQVRIQIPIEKDLEVRPLTSNTKIICASPEYIKKHGKPTTPQELYDHNCIIFGENKVWELCHKTNKELVKLDKLNGNIHCNNGEIIKELVLSGAGITLKSSCDIQEELADKKLIPLLTNYDIVHKTQFYAVYPVDGLKSLKLKAFVDFLGELKV
jgi:LysR family transcriptional activator of dmlA